MNGCDKILSRINSDCDEKIKAINAECANACSDILAEGRKKADKSALEIAEKAKVKASRIKAASKSKAELEVRNALLKKRREEIDITFNAVLDSMLALNNSEYFDLIYKLASKLKGHSGEILLNAKDISRLPSDFKQRLDEIGLNATVSNTPVDICGGFILKSGNIEENMDFSAIIAEKRDRIEDIINHELFTE